MKNISPQNTRLNVEIPEGLRRQAKIEAAKTGRTLKEILRELIQKWLSGEVKLENK